MGEYRGSGFPALVSSILRVARRWKQQAEHNKRSELHIKRWASDQQCLNLAEGCRSRHKDLVNTPRLHEALQDQHRCHPVNGLGALLHADLILTQQTVGFSGSEPLIPEVDWELETLPQFFRELGHFLRLCAFLAAHAQRVAQNNFFDLIFADDALQPAKISALVFALQR